MNDREQEELEHQIRLLRPAQLPADLRERLAEPPQAHLPKVKWLAAATAAGLATAACVALAFFAGDPPNVDDSSTPRTVTFHQQDSELLGSRELAIREHNGQLWQVIEEEWQHESLAMCTATPVTFRSTEKRKEIFCVPIDFL